MNPEKVLKFWLGEDLNSLKAENYKHKPELWFKLNYYTDELIKEKFLDVLKQAEDGKLDDWNNTTQGSLALIIIFDQFSRNIYRGSPDMFKNDHKALKIALKLIDNDYNDFQTLSPVEKFFVYLTLLHVENIETSKKSLDYIEKLTNESPLGQRKYFQKYLSSSKVHYELLAKHGRYPHRNNLLERESTKEELEFLSQSKHTFKKSVEPIKKPSNDSKPNLKQSNRKLTNLPFQNILFLHGFRQNSNKLKKRLISLINIIRNECNTNIHFLNGTHAYKPNGEIAEQLNTSLGEDLLNPIESQRIWFNSDDKAHVYNGINESVDYVLSHVKVNGPYDGIIGFGQGALLASIIVKNNPNIFRYLINISAFEPRSDLHKNLFSPNDPFDFPSLHIFGKNDILITPSRSEEFSKCFKNPQIAEHPAGHFAPNSWPIDKLTNFLKDQAKNLKPTEFSIEDTFELNILKLNEALLRFDVDKLNLEPFFKNNEINKNLFQNFLLNDSIDTIEYENCENIDDLKQKLFVIYLLLIKAKKEEINSETMLLTNKVLNLFLRIYLNNQSFENYIINNLFELIFIRSNLWKELILLCNLCFDYLTNSSHEKRANFLYNHLIGLFSNQLIKDLKFIDFKKKSFLIKQLLTIDTEHVNIDYESYSISDLAKFMPRIKSSIDKHSRIGRECANYLNPYKNSIQTESEYLNKIKILSYNHYRKVLTNVCFYIENTKKSFEDRNPRKYFNLAKHDKKVMEYLMQAPLSDAIINPVPEPVDVSSYEQLKPLYDWLSFHKSLHSFDENDLKFIRGTVTSDGRLDLCKQVIGSQGIKPLLLSMSNNKNIDRLLLGNNLVGDEAGEIIADFIKSGKSPLTVWYIAGNNLTHKGIAPITDALKNDEQVTALWLKRNPLKPAGMIPIGDLLNHNKTIQVLDLLNCGLLDDGVKILFKSLLNNNILKHLYLSANGITAIGLEYILDYYKGKKSCLETLFLGCNRIGNSGAKILSEILKYDDKLIRLNLASSRIGSEGMKYLSESLTNHKSIQFLDLGYMKATMDLGELGNYIENEGAFYLSELIEKNTNLIWLNITHNHITQKGIQMIVDALKKNKNILNLDYIQFGMSLNEITLSELRILLERNRNLIKEENPDFNLETFFIPEHVKEIYSVYRTH